MDETVPVLLASNRGYRYGDGLFETMKVHRGKILLAAYHWERLSAGMKLLGLEPPAFFEPARLEEQILSLSNKNNCGELARIRLSVFGGNGGLYDDHRDTQFLIEAWALPATVNKMNENGLVLGVYEGARKHIDHFSNLKSANFLPYTLAARYAKVQHWNDAIVLNTEGRIADTTIANIFLVKDGTILTPSLQEGGVAGVMRRWALENSPLPVQEGPITLADLKTADEIFVTNAIHGVRWVRQCGDQMYKYATAEIIYQVLSKTFS